jgi:hypothetical protein
MFFDTCRRPQPSSIENIVEEEEEEEDCTSRETFPNQEFEAAGTSRNSSPSEIYLGVPFRNGQSGTDETIRMLHTWFKRFVQVSLSPSFSHTKWALKPQHNKLNKICNNNDDTKRISCMDFLINYTPLRILC